jgi:hypothetical protein
LSRVVNKFLPEAIEIVLSLRSDSGTFKAAFAITIQPVVSANPGLGLCRILVVRTHGQGGHMSEEDLRAELERLRAENDQLKNKSVRGLSLKVSEKGGLSLYGVGRFPVTLYKEQWRKILAMAPEIEDFIVKNDSLLKTKE